MTLTRSGILKVTAVRPPNNPTLHWTGPAERSSVIRKLVGAGPASECQSVMPALNPRQSLLTRAALIVTVVGISFWLGRLSSPSPHATTLNSEVAMPLATVQSGEDDPVPVDPLKLDSKTLRIVNTVLARQVPMDLYIRANDLANFDQDHDISRLREALRSNLRIGVYSLATGAEGWGVTTGLNDRALRSLSTYYATVPDSELDPRARAWLAKFPPYSSTELVQSACENGICTLARRPTTRGSK